MMGCSRSEGAHSRACLIDFESRDVETGTTSYFFVSNELNPLFITVPSTDFEQKRDAGPAVYPSSTLLLFVVL